MTKAVLITGATAGIGQACARRFASEGWKVIGTGRRADRLDALKAELGDAFEGRIMDVRDTDFDALARDVGPVDCLLNNAGLAPPMTTMQDADQAPLDNAIETNISALVDLTRAVLPGLIERRGAVINLASVAATYPYKGGAVYAGTKAFVRQFSLGLRCDLAGTGVRVTSIEPGMVETEFTLVRNGGDQAASLQPHMNINALELMPVSQSWAGFAVEREGA